MTKQRIVTICITISLLSLAIFAYLTYSLGLVPHSPGSPMTMLFSTAAFVFGGCMLQSFGHRKASLILGSIVFFILCTCLLYAVCLRDYVIFAACMTLVVTRASNNCNCMNECDNPFR